MFQRFIGGHRLSLLGAKQSVFRHPVPGQPAGLRGAREGGPYDSLPTAGRTREASRRANVGGPVSSSRHPGSVGRVWRRCAGRPDR
jgi:hypothetical protein